MRSSRKKTAVALGETRLSPKYAIVLVVCYFFAAVLWFALGAILPYTAKVDVTAEQRARLTRDAFSATIEDCARPTELKERAALMPTSEDSFVQRLRLIERAEKTIDFMVYDSYEDVGAEYFYTALYRAADRGVRVRILVDGKLGRLSGTLKPLEDVLSFHNNIELYYFNVINLFRPADLLVLCHDKVTVIDGDKMIVGGANMGLAAYTANYDMEVLITGGGDCVKAARRYIEQITTNKRYAKRKKSKKCDISVMDKYELRLLAYLSDKSDCIDFQSRSIAVDKITYLTNPVTNGKKSPIIYCALVALAASSEQTTIVTPYALLTGDKIDEIRNIAANSKKFRLITNSLYNTRNAAYAVYQKDREKYIDESIELLEFQEINQLHAKIYSFDGRYSVIGSFNLDERSAHIDTESVVIIDSAEFNKVLTDYIDSRFVKNSLRVGRDNKYLPSDTVTAGETPKHKITKYKMLSAMGALIYLL